MATTVAAIVITKNEEKNIAACLDSVRWTHQLVVVDAESTDRTAELARWYTPQVFVRPWPGFGPQKNFAFEQVTCDWIFIVDADERVTDRLRDEIRRTLQQPVPGDVAGFEIPRRNYFYGQWLRGGGVYPDYQIRLIKRGSGRYDDTLVHERLLLDGRIARLAEPFEHHSIPTVGDHYRKIARYTSLAADEKLKGGGAVSGAHIGWHHLGTFAKVYLLRRGYVDGVPGLIAALFAGMYTFVKYAKAWELMEQRAARNEAVTHAHRI